MTRSLLSLRRRFRSVRVRLMLWYLVVMALLLLAFCGILYSVVSQVALRNLEANLRSTAQDLAMTYARFQQFPAEHQPVDPRNKNMIVLLFNARGEVIQTQGSLTPVMVRQLQQALPAPGEMTDRWLRSSATTESTEYHFFAMTLSDQSQELLLVGSPRTDQLVVHYLLLGMGLAGPAILLMAAGCGYWLATRAMRPVRVMTQVAREIEETDLSRRLNLQSQDELGELASTFDQMLSRLEAAFKRQRQFTADASHELRTPLSIITLAVNRGMAHCQTPEEYLQVLQTIHLENARMSRLVNDLLLLARADGEQTRLQKERVDVSDVVLDVVARLLPFAERCGMDLVPGDFPTLWVIGDEAALVSLFSNLIENALKYTAGVGNQILVEGGCEISEEKRWAWIRVEDNGPGIASNHLPYLFERFYRADGARSVPQSTAEETDDAPGRTGGSGLGLSIVQWIAHAHGGEVRVQSEVGRGSRFEVRLPLLDHEPTRRKQIDCSPS